MTENSQLIAFPVPEYLAMYFANKIGTSLHEEKGVISIPVNRHSYFGKIILKSIEVDHPPLKKNIQSRYFIEISNYAGNNYPDAPRGGRHFLDIRVEIIDSIIEAIKMDFDENLVAFVEGAEFAHSKNGWMPNQKRKGIRKTAILEFCTIHQVDLEHKSLQTLFKMYQRHKKSNETSGYRGLKKFGQLLSF